MFDYLVLSGGPVIWVLLFLSVLSLSVTLFKAWHLWSLRAPADTEISQGLENLGQGQSLHTQIKLQRRAKNPRVALLEQASKQWQDSTSSDIWQQNLNDVARRGLNNLGSHLRVLEVIAMIAPLLGLLGTVLGMIDAFKAMELAGSQVDPSVLSGGIWQALMTTALGLIIAIPVSVVHGWFERRVELCEQRLQSDITGLNTLHHQIQTERVQRTAPLTAAAA